jgi:hypothetical protein
VRCIAEQNRATVMPSRQIFMRQENAFAQGLAWPCLEDDHRFALPAPHHGERQAGNAGADNDNRLRGFGGGRHGGRSHAVDGKPDEHGGCGDRENPDAQADRRTPAVPFQCQFGILELFGWRESFACFTMAHSVRSFSVGVGSCLAPLVNSYL